MLKHLYYFKKKRFKFKSRNITTLRYKKSIKFARESIHLLNTIPKYIEVDYQSLIFILIVKSNISQTTNFM